MFVLLKEFTQGRCPQIFQKSTSHLQILSTRWWYVTCSIPRFCSSGLICEPVIWCFLLGAYELIHVTVWKKKLNRNAENIRWHCTTFSHLKFVHPWHKTCTQYFWHTKSEIYPTFLGPMNNESPIQMHTLWTQRRIRTPFSVASQHMWRRSRSPKVCYPSFSTRVFRSQISLSSKRSTCALTLLAFSRSRHFSNRRRFSVRVCWSGGWKWNRGLGNKSVTSKRHYMYQRLDGEASISCYWQQVSRQSQIIWSPWLRHRPITGRLFQIVLTTRGGSWVQVTAGVLRFVQKIYRVTSVFLCGVSFISFVE